MGNKDSLLKLIALIKEISEDKSNEWFKKQLLEILSPTTSVMKLDTSDLGENVSDIKRYLLIESIPIIDYTKISNQIVQNQLYRDCIEMGKYRLGKINNTIDFGEFCRYAHLQAEELVNYFLIENFNNKIEKITQFMKKHSSYKYIKEPTSIHHINYTNKLFALKNYARIEYNVFSVLNFLNEIRNELSHRNSLADDNEDQYLKAFEKAGFSLNQLIDFQKLSQEELDIYNKGKYIITKKKEDYINIYGAIDSFKDIIIELLIKKEITIPKRETLGDTIPGLLDIKNLFKNS